ncbi:Aromatic amino acid exporter YddG [Nymphon striatum]|nr:Aromatic amino acid exporter YddG [Nymphon striatum]
MERKTQKSKKLATLYGFAAILMWSLLALLTQKAGEVPPFQLAAITFFIGTCVGLVWLFVNKPAQTHSPTPKRILFWGGFSLFAYHALYFAALQNAPVEEASLIAFLWPLLIVVGSALLPNEKLHSHHIAGALMGFAGAAIIITGNNALTFKTEAALGYGLAFIAAFTWAAYSLLSRRISDLPTQSVIAYCAITTLLSIIAHLIFEVTTWPNTIEQWGAIIGLGLLPVGAAFYVWDHGMKHGDIQIIGASSYTAPLLSTIILVVFGSCSFEHGQSY